MGVLEHLNYDEVIDLVTSLKELMAEKSIIYVDVPNNDLRTIIDSTQGRFVPSFPHVQFFSRQSLMQMFEQADFSVVHIGTAGKTIEDTYGPGYQKPQQGILLKRIINKACRILLPRFILDYFRRTSELEQLLDAEYIIYDAIKRQDVRAVAIKK